MGQHKPCLQIGPCYWGQGTDLPTNRTQSLCKELLWIAAPLYPLQLKNYHLPLTQEKILALTCGTSLLNLLGICLFLRSLSFILIHSFRFPCFYVSLSLLRIFLRVLKFGAWSGHFMHQEGDYAFLRPEYCYLYCYHQNIVYGVNYNLHIRAKFKV